MPTALITGATDGLGRNVARDLASQGWTVLVLPGARTYVADLSSLAEVRRMAGEVVASEDSLDVLVNAPGSGAGGS